MEASFDRRREVRWGARNLDLDLVQYGDPATGTDVVSDRERLTLPHPRAHERAFVLQPWAQLDPHAVLPGLGGGPVGALAATAPDREGVRWLALDWLTAPIPAGNDTGAVQTGRPEAQDA